VEEKEEGGCKWGYLKLTCIKAYWSHILQNLAAGLDDAQALYLWWRMRKMKGKEGEEVNCHRRCAPPPSD
jgi:hypothetical protein